MKKVIHVYKPSLDFLNTSMTNDTLFRVLSQKNPSLTEIKNAYSILGEQKYFSQDDVSKLADNLYAFLADSAKSVKISFIQNCKLIQILMPDVSFATDEIYRILMQYKINVSLFLRDIVDLGDKKYIIAHIFLVSEINKNSDAIIRNISSSMQILLDGSTVYNKTNVLIKKYSSLYNQYNLKQEQIFTDNLSDWLVITDAIEKNGQNYTTASDQNAIQTYPDINEWLPSQTNISVTKIRISNNIEERYFDALRLKNPEDENNELIIIGFFKPTFLNNDDNTKYIFFADLVDRFMQFSGFISDSYNYRQARFIMKYFPKQALVNADFDLLRITLNDFLNNPFDNTNRVYFKAIDAKFSHFVLFSRSINWSESTKNNILRLIKSDLRGVKVVTKTIIDLDASWIMLHLIFSHADAPNPNDVTSVVDKINRNTESFEVKLLKLPHDSKLLHEASGIFPETYKNDLFAVRYLEKDLECINFLVASDRNIKIAIVKDEFGFAGGYILKVFSKSRLTISVITNCVASLGFNLAYIHQFHLNTSCGDSFLYNLSIELGALNPDLLDINTDCIELSSALIFDSLSFSKLNHLICYGLDLKKVQVLEAIAAYTAQINSSLSSDIIFDAILKNVNFAKELFTIFELKFDAKKHNIDLALQRLNSLREEVFKLNNQLHIKIFDLMISVLDAIARTNFYQNGKSTIAFKLKSEKIPNLPKPIPYAEIFVYHQDFEGCHLRDKPVSRGGFRWSDRRDYRTEVLGLVKAQVSKNAIIIPSGAKACFYIKTQKADKNENIAFVKDCYKNFVSSLLDLTDNITSGVVTNPENTLIYDDIADPYIVAAADKGTATFSDLANAISKEKGFWLGDAFASGGSNGYDHKKMGITSRGAYVCSKNSFYELGIDVENSEITAIGIGDMSGDVFGNGMLLYKHLKLIAAFNHQHIFIDPKPNIEIAFQERQRLFNNPQLRWSDYDSSKISHGGGVFERFGNPIFITEEIRLALNIPMEIGRIEGEVLINYILKAQVDLIWNGGIGTFIKAESESNADVKDIFNDNIRINGNQVRAKVIAEGGNVGITQLGRIECSAKGIKVNMDAIDNSAGVSCSDHEVNIKIAIRDLPMAEQERNDFLASMQDDVAALVLKDNYLQSKLIGVSDKFKAADTHLYAKLAVKMAKSGIFDPKLQSFPTESEMQAILLSGETLSRTHICVLVSHAKMYLHNAILDSTIISDTYCNNDLVSYFPSPMRSGKFESAILNHQLKQNIIATSIANEIINFCGITYIEKMQQIRGVSLDKIAFVYKVLDGFFKFDEMFEMLFKDDNVLPFEQQAGAIRKLQDAILNASLFIMKLIDFEKGILENISQIKPVIDKFFVILKGSCCSQIKTSCCFDAEYTARLKVLKSIYKICNIISTSKANPELGFELLYQQYIKAEEILGSGKIYRFFTKSISENTGNAMVNIFVLDQLADILKNALGNSLAGSVLDKSIAKIAKITHAMEDGDYISDSSGLELVLQLGMIS